MVGNRLVALCGERQQKVAARAATFTTVLFSAAPIIGHARVSRTLRDTTIGVAAGAVALALSHVIRDCCTS